jgi:folate-binding protein YgfZ
MAELAKLDSRAVLAVTGEDARSFLQGLVTQDVETLAPGELRFGALLTPQGKLLYDLFLFGREDGVWLDCAAERREELTRRLALYRLRAKVEIAAVDVPVFAAWDAGDHQTSARPAEMGADPRVADLGFRQYGEAAGAALPESAHHAHRLALGVPDPAADGADAYPIEANFDLLNGIDFRKGCFVGQETTSRMKRRGQIKTRMLPIAFDGPPPAFGAEVLAGDLRAGEVRSGRDGRAIALLRLDRIDGAELTVDGRPVRVERPAWFERALQA